MPACIHTISPELEKPRHLPQLQGCAVLPPNFDLPAPPCDILLADCPCECLHAVEHDSDLGISKQAA